MSRRSKNQRKQVVSPSTPARPLPVPATRATATPVALPPVVPAELFDEYSDTDEHLDAMEQGLHALASDSVIPAEQEPPAAVQPTIRPEAAVITPPVSVSASATGVIENQLVQMSESLRREFQSSIAELQANQAAAVAAQSEVLKTLSEMIYQSAARDPDQNSIERAVAAMEERLLSRIQTATPTAPSTSFTAPTATNPIPTPFSASVTSMPTVSDQKKHAGFASKLPKPSSSVVKSWDEIRTELMSHSDLSEASVSIMTSEPAPAPIEPAVQEDSLNEATQLSSDRHFKLPEQDPLLEVPAPVDADLLNEAQLREALRERETFISTLIARIRRQHECKTGLLSAEQLRSLLTEMPEDLANLTRVTLRRMDELARMGELEMALERARIARQLNQLQHSRQIIEHNARQLGMTLNPDGSISVSGSQNRGSTSRRWLGKLGFGQ